MERIQLTKTWVYGGRDAQGRTNMLHPGVYIVGTSIKKDLADRALKAGVAVRVESPKPKPIRRTPFKSKGLAPENKAIDAPGNHNPTVE